ncbi:MAG: hypothetical protein RMJ15_05495 [Nitrososphaerota archaeon]|nr:hypothetical protein [Candidatus Bathyarchaeota archaeon]MDW8023170.1 hypothetical protein [Nitrososphaerota archaeon]
MALTEKALKALEFAEGYLEKSLSALNKDEKNFADGIWHVAAELEYALFLFYLMSKGEYDVAEWKPNPEHQKIGTNETVAKVMELLKESKKALVNKDLIGAHKYAYIARQYVFRIQEGFVKKKHESLGK